MTLGIEASGEQSGNMHRDLVRALGKPRGSPDFFDWPIPMQGDGPGGQVQIKAHPFILPHEMFSRLHAERLETFFQCVQGDDAERGALWDGLVNLPVVQKHPSLDPNQLQRTIPLGMHGDAGAFSKQDSLFVLTWNSLVGQGTTREQRFLITCVRKSDLLADGSTLEAIFHVLAWSFNCLLTGQTPHQDPDGLPLEGGGKALAGLWRGACIQIRGDWQFYCQAFGFPLWNTDSRMCWLCRASNIHKELLWTNFNANAPWRQTLWTHESYMADVESKGELPPNVFGICGLRLECIMVDVLHAVDLGIASQIIGNVLYEILPRFGPNKDVQIQALNSRLKTWYRENKVTSQIRGKLTMSALKAPGKSPELKAKAAATRHIAPFAAQLAAEFNDGTLHDVRRQAVIDSLVDFYTIIEHGSRQISDKGLQRLPACCQQLCTAYAFLASEAEQAQEPAWKEKPKMHLFQHLCLYQAHQFGNPRYYWTYPDEDMVGQMVEVAKSCHPSTMAKTALYKWLVMVFKD